ncbi:hypothetical protein ENKNEFLB_03536 [Nocardioides aquaticus]|uniref:Type II secretion system protein GspF domain-containing protein n=1 Tax=Nocardioides aquaticus TaxID=160826 RepID=A0ABX8EPF5_9ACTN|nr:type II secretion system F family protein [Nocardioides aquaticus]QVT81128.1 hypothetical protein ENKNEFLB_03536 [Nocardioides aquaticus]
MTPAVWGAVCGLGAGLGLIVVLGRVLVLRRTQVAVRVLPYVRDLPLVGRPAGLPVGAGGDPASVVTGVLGPVLGRAARTVDRVLGGSSSVQWRLRRCGSDRGVHDFRVEQVLWGLTGFALAAAYGVLVTVTGRGDPLVLVTLCVAAFVGGVVLRDRRLSAQVAARERRILAEFPTVAELLALAVAAGEGPVAALDRVVRRSGGELSADLARVLASVRTGEPVGVAFDGMAASSGLPLVARFAQGVAVAVERGTPLADVLHAQAADVREAGRRELIEAASRREVLMMAPVVFLVLPVTILFAFWPGFVGLSLTT